jgi:protein gp37
VSVLSRFRRPDPRTLTSQQIFDQLAPSIREDARTYVLHGDNMWGNSITWQTAPSDEDLNKGVVVGWLSLKPRAGDRLLVTAIEWTDVSWNPVHGCSKVSPGCAHCYAETLSLRYRQTTKPWTPENAAENVTLKPHKLREPLSKAKPWDKPCRVFVNSMSDLFHELVPDEYIAKVFGVMANAPQHTFQVLTKRPERMRAAALMDGSASSSGRRSARRPRAPNGWALHRVVRRRLPDNVWLGTSIENRRYVSRAHRPAPRDAGRGPVHQRRAAAGPLVGSETDPGLDLSDIDWLIVGGESAPATGRSARSGSATFATAPAAQSTAFFFKQWGGHTPKAGGRELDGRTWDEMPVRRPVTAAQREERP